MKRAEISPLKRSKQLSRHFSGKKGERLREIAPVLPIFLLKTFCESIVLINLHSTSSVLSQEEEEEEESPGLGARLHGGNFFPLSLVLWQ